MTVTGPVVPPVAAGLTGPALSDASREFHLAVSHSVTVGGQLTGRIAAALQAAGAADDTASGVLGGLQVPQISPPPMPTSTSTSMPMSMPMSVSLPGEAAPGGALSVLPPAGADPTRTAAWWASLSPSAQQLLLILQPDLLGGMDGVPAAVRDQANRARLPGLRTGLQAELRRLQDAQTLRQAQERAAFGVTSTADDDPPLRQLRDKLAALDAIEGVLRQPDRHLLVLDTTGEQTAAAVAVGDVDTADNVGVYVPGFTTTVQDSLVGSDLAMSSMRKHADAIARTAGTGSVATVAWLGYQMPQWGNALTPSQSVMGRRAAQLGAEKLQPFLAGLDTARISPSHLTVLGHSYGSVTAGLALQQHDGVDDAVFFGSPGLGTSTVGDLHVPSGHAYDIEAEGDYVGDLTPFGDDPNHLPGMTQLSAQQETIDGQTLSAPTGHTSYLHEGTVSQYDMAAVVAGTPQDAPLSDNPLGGWGDVLAHGPSVEEYQAWAQHQIAEGAHQAGEAAADAAQAAADAAARAGHDVWDRLTPSFRGRP